MAAIESNIRRLVPFPALIVITLVPEDGSTGWSSEIIFNPLPLMQQS
jgi:hypothetical protein